MNEEQLTPSEAVDETSAQATGVAPSPEEIPAVEVTSEPTADAPETTPAAASGKTDDEMLFEA